MKKQIPYAVSQRKLKILRSFKEPNELKKKQHRNIATWIESNDHVLLNIDGFKPICGKKF